VILAAVLLKMGTYGFLRFSLPILPEASRQFVPMVVLLCIIGIVYGALVALAQRDWKRLVAYSSVSHMAMVMLGMFALNPVGITAASCSSSITAFRPARSSSSSASSTSGGTRARFPSMAASRR
jgi:NADH:ubiquinone oxidoreductase subunit 4 (subunit M)